MEQMEVHILQQRYMLACPEAQQARLLQAVRCVDEAMTRIRDSGKLHLREHIAVMAAVNIAFEASEPAPQHAAQQGDGQAQQQEQQALAEQLLQRLEQALQETAWAGGAEPGAKEALSESGG